MKLKKIFWLIKSFIYKCYFKKFGNMSYIAKPIFLSGVDKVIIENRVRIYPGMRMECIGDSSKILIKENTSIGQNLHLISNGNLIIGRNTTISGNVFITNMDHEYQEIGKHILEQKYKTNDTIIGDNCFIGYGAVIQAGTKLGKQCIVGSNSVVRGSFPDYCVLVGSPARIVKKYNHNTRKWEKYNEKNSDICR